MLTPHPLESSRLWGRLLQAVDWEAGRFFRHGRGGQSQELGRMLGCEVSRTKISRTIVSFSAYALNRNSALMWRKVSGIALRETLGQSRPPYSLSRGSTYITYPFYLAHPELNTGSISVSALSRPTHLLCTPKRERMAACTCIPQHL